MSAQDPQGAIAFAGSTRIASGPLHDVAAKVKRALDDGEWGPVLIFDERTSEPIEIDFRGTTDEILARLAWPNATATSSSNGERAQRGPGRPKLGVVSREVTLLPRHWEWLNRQPGGASVALRKLVEEARGTHNERDAVRQARDAAYRFMSSMAGNESGFEEATRALFAGNAARFEKFTKSWPVDVREHAVRLASVSFEASAKQG